MQQEWRLTDAKNPTPDEINQLFRIARKFDARERLMIVLAYNGALRVSELIHVMVPDFHWLSGNLSMIPCKKAGKKRVRRADGSVFVVEKPLPKPEEIPLDKEVLSLARAYINQEGLDSWLFPGDTTPEGCHVVKRECPGGHISKRKVQMIFDEIATAAGIKIPSRGIHALKHGRLTEVATKTRDPWMVKQAGRHSSISMADHYVKAVDYAEKMRKLGGKL